MQVTHEHITPDQAFEQAEQLATKLHAKQRPATSSQATVKALCTGLCCQFLIQSGRSDLVRIGVSRFRNLIDSPIATALPQLEQLTWTIRYVMALTPNVTALEYPRRALEDALQLLEKAEPKLPVGKNPALKRDVLIFKGRILRELSRWSAPRLEEAIACFKAGLEVDGARYAREARGRALGDFASALAQVPGERRPDNTFIADLYLEAASLLTEEEFPSSRAIVLRNLAVFYNERTDGIRRENQEKALHFINDAIQTIEPTRAKYGGIHFQELLAVLHQTKGNIIRSRAYADESKRRALAIEAYERGLQSLTGIDHHELMGEFCLNLAYSYLEDISIPGALDQAVEKLETAIQLLHGFPSGLARARVAFAEAWMMNRTGGPASWRRRIAEVEESILAFERAADWEGVGKACWCLSDLTLLNYDLMNDMNLSKAAALLVRAASSFHECGDLIRSVGVCRELADILVQLAAILPDHRVQHLEHARETVLQAIAYIDDLWERSNATSWHLSWSKQKNFFYSCLLWIESNLGATIHRRWAIARRAKSNELLTHLIHAQLGENAGGNEGGVYRRLAMMYEADLLRKGTKIGPDRDINDKLRDVDLAYDQYEQALIESELSRLGTSRPPLDTDSRAPNLPGSDAVICDLTTSPWGTIALWTGRGLPPEGASVALPLDLDDLGQLLFGREDSPGWLMAYTKRRTAPLEWRKATADLISELSPTLWEPCLEQLSVSLERAHLYIVPGSFYGLPLHACAPHGKPLVDSVTSLAFVPHLDLIEPRRDRTPLKDALCILSDPDDPVNKRLQAAPGEIQRIATALSNAGINVALVASSGNLAGRDVFDSRNLPLPSTITVAPFRPTPEWVQENLHNYDFLVYSGHGSSSGMLEPILLLVDDAGKAKPLRLFDVLSAPALLRAPIILLSACETAREESTGFDDQHSVASALLRIGARHVLGTLWVADDETAATFSEKFCLELIGGTAPDAAFINAVQVLDRSTPEKWATFCLWHAHFIPTSALPAEDPRSSTTPITT